MNIWIDVGLSAVILGGLWFLWWDRRRWFWGTVEALYLWKCGKIIQGERWERK
tara:strand:+ start:650 stop:808 length:159 start_codon:yes stop_codon:yes gene_type:complete